MVFKLSQIAIVFGLVDLLHLNQLHSGLKVVLRINVYLLNITVVWEKFDIKKFSSLVRHNEN